MGLKKTDFKDLAKDVFYYSGIAGLFLQVAKFYRHPALLILTYHRVYDSLADYEYLGVSRDVFESHIKFIKDNFKVVSMQEGIGALCEIKSKEIYAAINLDDGYMDNYINAFPVLKKYNIPATIFLTTDFIGKSHIFWWDRVFNIMSFVGSSRLESGIETDRIDKILVNKNEDEIEGFIRDMEKRYGYKENHVPCPMLGWAEIKEMSNSGISFEAHTKTHKNLCLLKDRKVLEELTGSKNAIEAGLGKEVFGFSYPFGIFDQRIKGLVKQAGFKYARTSFKAFNYKEIDPFLLSCIGAGAVSKPSFLAARLSSSLFNTGGRQHGY
ncbi:MAG: polysaccharide deacetylase family protein [Candidatus Omnitrophota bacterium]